MLRCIARILGSLISGLLALAECLSLRLRRFARFFDAVGNVLNRGWAVLADGCCGPSSTLSEGLGESRDGSAGGKLAA